MCDDTAYTASCSITDIIDATLHCRCLAKQKKSSSTKQTKICIEVINVRPKKKV